MPLELIIPILQWRIHGNVTDRRILHALARLRPTSCPKSPPIQLPLEGAQIPVLAAQKLC